MPTVRSTRDARRIAALGSTLIAALTASLVLSAGPAFADTKIGEGAQDTEVTGDAGDDGTLSAQAGAVTYDRSNNGTGAKAGPVAPIGNWTPPPCWYAPKYTPKQFKDTVEPIWEAESTGYQWDAEQRDRYVNGKPYKDFNLDKAGEGYWWDSYPADGFPAGWDSCEKPTFWVDQGDPPPANIPEAITPEILAQLAYNEVRVPGTEVELAPEVTTKVNLPTWAWLDQAQFRPVSVTASVPALGIEATTTAEPHSLKIEPGTKDATLHPASGVCPINDGRVGTPYTKGNAKKTPPCGLTYLRSSGDASYELQATVTWKIHWTGTGVADPKELPDGQFGATQDITVEEIQSINR